MNHLLADDSREMPSLIFSEKKKFAQKIKKDIAQFFISCSHDEDFKGKESSLFGFKN